MVSFYILIMYHMVQYLYNVRSDVLPKRIRVSREMILTAAFDITREKGIDAVSNREIARRLNSSIRPIYYQFSSSMELNVKLVDKISKYFYSYILDSLNDDLPKYKQVGLNYIRFALEEKNFFRVLFMDELYHDEIVSPFDDKNFKIIADLIKKSTEIDDNNIKNFHNLMWIYTHGLACLCASGRVDYSLEDIKRLLTDGFEAFVNLNNK